MKKMSTKVIFSSLLAWILFSPMLCAQAPEQWNSSRIYHELQKLSHNGRVLYLAAHPDDENTRFITYSANSKKLETAYLSLTRGDGGQNRIGSNIREELGIIRTQELLAARRIDGGQQFFTRANDFGYSKTADETLSIWDEEVVLSDMIWVIRKFKPDLIVCRFPDSNYGGHGHHIAATLLAKKAFTMAASEAHYPQQLALVEPWQAERMVVNTGRWWNDTISADDPGVVAIDVGKYSPILGQSCTEIAALSRSMHKSQAFGTEGTRGETIEYFEHLAGTQAKEDLFEGIDRSWSEVLNKHKDGDRIQFMIDQLLENYDFKRPHKSMPNLVDLYKTLSKQESSVYIESQKERVKDLLLQSGGIYLKAVSRDGHIYTVGDSIHIELELIARNCEATLANIKSKELPMNGIGLKRMPKNQILTEGIHTVIPENIDISQAYWLKQKAELGYYHVDDPSLIGEPENKATIIFNMSLNIEGELLNFSVPLIHQWRDPVVGERHRPVYIYPSLTLNPNDKVHIFYNDSAKRLSFDLIAHKDLSNVQIETQAPNGWSIQPRSWSFDELKKGQVISLEAMAGASENAATGIIHFRSNQAGDGQVTMRSHSDIFFDHIPAQVYFPKAEVRLINLQVQTRGDRIAYIPGAGDEVPKALVNMGYKVDVLTSIDPLKSVDLNRDYDAVMLGIRALNVRDDIKNLMPKLLDYAKNGGTLVLQYNTSYRMKTSDFAPYSLEISRDRVTDESSEVQFLSPDHPVLNEPNRIVEADFQHWVQERGLYFPSQWDDHFVPILRWNDKGEGPKDGALLIAKYGQGHYVYTGISFFRELPAGVPGAYRLLANILSLGNE